MRNFSSGMTRTPCGHLSHTCSWHRPVSGLKGLKKPVQVYEAVRPSGMRSRLDVQGVDGLTPLVGRQAELRIFRDRWRRAQEGYGQALLEEVAQTVADGEDVQAELRYLFTSLSS